MGKTELQVSEIGFGGEWLERHPEEDGIDLIHFDMLSVSEDIDTMFAEEFDAGLKGTAPDRTKLYRTCEENDVGITVMKGFAGGRLFDEERCPFGVPIAERMQKTAELFGR